MNTYDFIRNNYILSRAYGGHTEIADANRNDLAELFHKLDFKVGAEIGVAAGEYSETLLKANPQATVYSVDPWLPYSGYKDYVKESTFARLEEQTRSRLGQYPNSVIVKALSLDALAQFKDESLDFVYIDANHSEPFVTQDITEWSKKVRKDGIVAGHDYARLKGNNREGSSNWAVVQAITKYTEDNGLDLFVWGLNAKIPQLKRDASRSWMYVKK